MNKNLIIDLGNSGMNEKGDYVMILVATCNLQEYKEIIGKMKENNRIEAKL